MSRDYKAAQAVNFESCCGRSTPKEHEGAFENEGGTLKIGFLCEQEDVGQPGGQVSRGHRTTDRVRYDTTPRGRRNVYGAVYHR